MSGFKKALQEAADNEKQQITNAGSPKAKPNDEPKKESKATPPAEPKAPKKKKSNAGRKKIDPGKQRQQAMLTLAPETMEKLSEFGKDYKKLLNRYIDKNIDEIVEALEKL